MGGGGVIKREPAKTRGMIMRRVRGNWCNTAEKSSASRVCYSHVEQDAVAQEDGEANCHGGKPLVADGTDVDGSHVHCSKCVAGCWIERGRPACTQ